MKRYTGTCYIGVVGGDNTPTRALTSIMSIKRRDGDSVPKFIMATKGFSARQMHVDAFMESGHDFMLFLDHDMIFEPDTLERLRSHERPYISGLYLRRQTAPLGLIWYKPFSGEWPFENWIDDPQRGKLHEIGASGWGCMLVHRDVITDTREILKGEPDIIEDDMDVWPYDLNAVMSGSEKIRPLRVDKKVIVGSDVRYPFYAKAAGYTLYGDPDVRPSHVTEYALRCDDYAAMTGEPLEHLRTITNEEIAKRRNEIRRLKAALV
ncbi:MAG: glycosyltransferase [Anaerolineae bacterium]|nr:glycosyltransferase [Anaerolineae bacterium]